MKVRFTLEKRLITLKRYTHNCRYSSQAARVAKHLYHECDRLADFPQLGHVGTAPGTYKWIVPRLLFIIVHKIFDDHEEMGVYRGAQQR